MLEQSMDFSFEFAAENTPLSGSGNASADVFTYKRNKKSGITRAGFYLQNK